jgi:ribonucleotide monophosphatase NagD (HAD superfamily)
MVRRKSGFIIDMDGVVFHGDQLMRGVIEFIGWFGDLMDTDIIAGIESEIETVLVLSGVTA